MKLSDWRNAHCKTGSLPSLGAWIETNDGDRCYRHDTGRSLHWERGLKQPAALRALAAGSRSLHWERGLKRQKKIPHHERDGRSLHWERGLKQIRRLSMYSSCGRSLHWERGLKRLHDQHTEQDQRRPSVSIIVGQLHPII